MPQVIANQIKLEYDEFGRADSPAVLLIMGLGTQMIAWSTEFCQRLASGGYRVIRFDNRDVGLSQKMRNAETPRLLWLLLCRALQLPVRAPYTLEDMAADALGLLDALDIDQAHIVGASMGGMIAQLIAAQAPERTLTLSPIMSSSGRRGLPLADREVRRRLFMRVPSHEDKVAFVSHAAETFRMLGSPGFPRSEKQWRELVGRAFDRGVYPAGLFRQLAAIISNGSRSYLLRKVRVPTLVIHGTDDRLLPLEHGFDLLKQIPTARLEAIEGMGHDLPPQLVPRLVDLLHAHFSTVTECTA